ncbi:Hypothetical protein Minf_0861 [Methylacidiphilum infernorum V4]|uniref:Uncharacterized protein n=1 Tax=Methylacidiphilum infernorum (isolate V4) TaxID=481448 RepID=B3E1C0_METI4|nr:Hypothetical protein Minf_0861 [Methylacidiphilum infernorum V4]
MDADGLGCGGEYLKYPYLFALFSRNVLPRLLPTKIPHAQDGTRDL